MQISDLPAVNAALNGLVAIFLTTDYVLIRRELHKRCMLAALTTAARGLSAQYDRHVRLARWTLPLWLYVSVTGVVIYLMLYRLY